MTLGNNPPEKLHKDSLIGVAVLLTSIKQAAQDDLADRKVAKIIPLEIKAQKIASLPISSAMRQSAEKSKTAILQYLQSQGAIEAVQLINEPAEYDYWVTIKPERFMDFYSKVLPLVIPYIEEVLRLDNVSAHQKPIPKPQGDISVTKLKYDPETSIIEDTTTGLPPLVLTSKQHKYLMNKLWAAEQHAMNIKPLVEEFNQLQADKLGLDYTDTTAFVDTSGDYPFKSSCGKLKQNIKKNFKIEKAVYFDSATNNYKLNQQHFL